MNKLKKSLLIFLLALFYLSCQSTTPGLKSADYKQLSEKYPGADFRRIDSLMLSPPAIAEVSVLDLGNYISSIADNDWEAVRGAFIWITDNISYDTDRYFNSIEHDKRKDDAFYDRKGLCSGYASLLSHLLTDLSIENRIISGIAYGNTEPEGHAWNAVKIGDKWHLFDATWAAGHINAKEDFSQTYNDYYFDVKPEELIFSHRPDILENSFVSKPALLENIDSLNQYWGILFRYGMDSEDIITDPELCTSNSLVKAYGLPAELSRSLSIESVPASYIIESGKEYYFDITVNTDTILIINENIEKRFRPRGNNFNFSYRPRTGNLEILLHYDDSYYLLLKYSVKS